MNITMDEFVTRAKGAVKGLVLRGLLGAQSKEATTAKSEIRALMALAIYHHLVMEITYADRDGEITHRCVEPVEFQADGNVLTHCRLRGGEYRAFSIDWIFSARWTGDLFVPQREKAHPARVPDLRVS